MPQLDVYIFWQLIIYSIILLYVLYVSNTLILLINTNLVLQVRRLKLYVEKRKVKRIILMLKKNIFLYFFFKNNRILINFINNIKSTLFIKGLLDLFVFLQSTALLLNKKCKEKVNLFFLLNIESRRLTF